MNPIVLNFDSRFFKVLKFISGKRDYFYKHRDWDTCSLTQHCLFVFLIVLPFKTVLTCAPFFVLAVGVGSIGFISMVDGLGIPPAWYWYPVYLLLGMAQVCVALALLGAIAWTCDKTWQYLTKPRERLSPPSPVGIMYASWKDKVCAKVIIK